MLLPVIMASFAQSQASLDSEHLRKLPSHFELSVNESGACSLESGFFGRENFVTVDLSIPSFPLLLGEWDLLFI